MSFSEDRFINPGLDSRGRHVEIWSWLPASFVHTSTGHTYFVTYRGLAPENQSIQFFLRLTVYALVLRYLDGER